MPAHHVHQRIDLNAHLEREAGDALRGEADCLRSRWPAGRSPRCHGTRGGCLRAGALVGLSGLLAGFMFGRVAQLRYTESMKTATIPSVRVEPELRAEVESLLGEGETLSEFVEASVRASVQRRRVQAEFIARGLRSLDEARRTGEYVDADVVIGELQRKLEAARARKPKTRK
jgi:Arc/MetJ-type ribon-helix-helix transcriptional regulator